jgi:hypothetical protein
MKRKNKSKNKSKHNIINISSYSNIKINTKSNTNQNTPINTMDYNIFNEDKTNIKYIKFGKTQSFNNKKYIPIYYNDQQSKKTKYNDFLIKTPRLFIPNKVRKEIGYKPSIETIMIEGDDEGIAYFKEIFSKIEKKIYNQIKKRKRLNLKEKEFLSIIKDDYKYKTKKLYLPLNTYTSSCIDINNKIIKEWDFIAPTYGYFIIQIKNIWIGENKWGINLFCNAAMILPSQLMDPPPIPVQKVQYMFESEMNSLKTIGEDERFIKFFKMKKMGIPVQAIKNKMIIEKVSHNIIDLKPDTPLNSIKFSLEDTSLNKTIVNKHFKYPNISNNIPPPPSLPPSLSQPIFSNNTNSQKTKLDVKSQLFDELKSRGTSILKSSANNNNNKQPKSSKKLINKTDDRVPSLEQIKIAIQKMKTNSCC